MSSFVNHPLIRENVLESRVYQQILFSEVIKGNTLVILPTGLGKTAIMTMAIARFIHKFPEKKVIVTAPTKPLSDQHLGSMKRFLNVQPTKINFISGSIQPKDRIEYWQNSRIIIATPQVLRNDIIANAFDLSEISLICFDEVHRAVGDDPYVFSAQIYSSKISGSHIIGFTASPGKKEKLNQIIENLKITNVQFMDESHPSVKPYINEIDEHWLQIPLPSEYKQILDELDHYLKYHLKLLKDHGIIESIQIPKNPKKKILGFPSKINSLRPQMGDEIYFDAMRAYGQLMWTSQAKEMLETQGIKTLQKFFFSKLEEVKISHKRTLKVFLENPVILGIRNSIKNLLDAKFIDPKVKALESLILDELAREKESRILVFANYKATTDFLVNHLNELNGVKAHRFVGQATSKYGKGLSQKDQIEVLARFKEGEYNILVSTSIGEEGLDVAQCDLVVFFDVTPSSTRLIQRSGRTGRTRVGKVVIMMMKGTRDEGYFYASQRQRSKLRSEVEGIQKEIGQKIMVENNGNSRLDDFLEYETPDETSATIPEFVKSGGTDNENQILILVDHREKGSAIYKDLLLEDVKIQQDTLHVGDFVLSDKIGVERKTTSDFCKTLIRNELFGQLIQLKNSYNTPILILEGENEFDCNISQNSIRGALSSIIIDIGVPIVRTSSTKETVHMLLTIARREQSSKKSKPKLRKSFERSSIEEIQLNLISTLPNVDRILAERLLQHFKSPYNVFNASEDELILIKGIGRQKAKTIIDLIKSEKFNGPFV